MSPVAIPRSNEHGVLPPFSPASPTSAHRSPYVVSLSSFIDRYATTPERKSILVGFMNFRSALHGVGLEKGFQWINGSFLEDIELIEGRPPADIDVVTFYYLPSGFTQQDLLNANPELFNHAENKANFKVDAYFSELKLKKSSPEPLVQSVTYWYSMWSHRRDSLWKGYLHVDLASAEDPSPTSILNTRLSQERFTHEDH